MVLPSSNTFYNAYGHNEEDQTLMRLRQVIKRCLRQTGSAYRYGGKEFTILLPETTDKRLRDDGGKNPDGV